MRDFIFSSSVGTEQEITWEPAIPEVRADRLSWSVREPDGAPAIPDGGLSVTVTPSDSTDLAVITKALRVAATGTGGIVRVVTEAGTTRDLPIAAGEQWDVRVSRVLATGTTASGIWALV